MILLALATSQHLRGCENWFVLATASCPNNSGDHCFHMIVLSLVVIEASRSVPYYPENLYYSIPPRLPIWEITAYWPHIKKAMSQALKAPTKSWPLCIFYDTAWDFPQKRSDKLLISLQTDCISWDVHTKKVQGKHAEDTSNAEARQQGHTARNLNPIKQWQRE